VAARNSRIRFSLLMFSQENPEKKKKNCYLWLFDALAEVSGRML
jgi:hypothetical protein